MYIPGTYIIGMMVVWCALVGGKGCHWDLHVCPALLPDSLAVWWVGPATGCLLCRPYRLAHVCECSPAPLLRFWVLGRGLMYCSQQGGGSPSWGGA
jgi:hypothetical protein